MIDQSRLAHLFASLIIVMAAIEIGPSRPPRSDRIGSGPIVGERASERAAERGSKVTLRRPKNADKSQYRRPVVASRSFPVPLS